MTDAELVAAGWHELTLTTDTYPKWKQRGFPANTHWGKAKAYFDQVVGGVVPPPPPPVSNSYIEEDFADFSQPPWDGMHTYYGTGWTDIATGAPKQGDPSGRLTTVAAPDGLGRAYRFEIRDNDPGWPPDTSVDRTQLMMSTATTWNQSALSVGDVRWFDVEFYLPNEFDFARANWNTYIGIHPGANTWGCCDVGMDGPYSHPCYMTFKVAGGSPIGTTANLKYIPLWQLTNADGSVFAPNRNRRISLRYGAKFAPDNTGWLEIWVDGNNVFPRTNRPTMWVGDTGSYFKIGPYKRKADHFPSGKTVLYVTRLAISR